MAETITLLLSGWPVIVGLLTVIGGYLNLQNRVKNLEEREKDRNKDITAMNKKLDSLVTMMAEVRGELRMRRRKMRGQEEDYEDEDA